MVSTNNLTWTYYCNHFMTCADRPKILLQNINNHVCTRLYAVLTQTTLRILTTASTSNSVPKIKKWNVGWNVTLGKLDYRRAVSLHSIQYHILFPPPVCTCLFGLVYLFIQCHIYNIGHVNYRLQFTTHLVIYKHLHNTK